MPKGLDTRGKYYNSTSPEEVNRGVYGKYSAEQIEERIELHAKRLHDRCPTIQEICDHFHKEYGVDISYQSEKEWANRDKNKARILAKQDEMIGNGKLLINSISRQTLLNSLSEGARAEAAFLKLVKRQAHTAFNNFDPNSAPWAIVGCTKSEYINATPQQLKDWKPRVDLELKVKGGVLKMAKDLSKIMKDHSEEVRLLVQQANDMGDRVAARDHANQKKFATKKHQESLTKATADEKLIGSEPVAYEEVDLDLARKALKVE